MPLSRIQTTLFSGDISDSVLRSLLAPPAPTGLTVTGGNAQASLSWVAPTVLSQTPITDYTKQYSTDNGTTWTTFSAAASTSTSATVTGLTNDTAVIFRVAAVNSVGVGAYTAASSSVTPISGTPPNAPTSLTATAGNAQIALAWTAPSAPGTYAITGYTVEYTPSGGSAQTVSTGSTGTTYTLTGLTNGTAYTVRVRAVSASGDGTYTAASSSITPTSVALDPFFSSVSLLIQADGSGSTFVDTSSSPKTITAVNATQSTVQSKFGGKAAQFGVGAYLTVPDSAAVSFGTGNFTLEAWVWTDQSGQEQAILGKWGTDGNDWLLRVETSNRLRFYLLSGAITSSTTLPLNQWNHVAVTRSSGTVTIWLNGSSVASGSGSDNMDTSVVLSVGAYSPFGGYVSFWLGYLDDVRITKGVSRYSATFTPPIATFPTS
jgi:hypothetical protein